MEDKIDRFGLCPNCQTSWNAGDALEVISRMNCFSHLSREQHIKIASNYGWTPHNKTNFSKTISHELEDGRHLIECPNITCKHVFNRYTGEEYRNMFDAKRNAPILKQGEFPTKEIPLADPEMYKTQILHVTPENRQQIELEMHRKLSLEVPRINPNDIECPFNENI